MAIAVSTARPGLARRVGDHEQSSKVSAFLMLSLLIVGLAGLVLLLQAVQAPADRAERTARPISPIVGAVPAAGPAAPSANELPAASSVADPVAASSVAEHVAPQATAAAAAPPPGAVAAPADAPAPDVPAADSPLAVGSVVRVANTDGVGVILYTAPRAGGRSPRGLLEGARVTVVERSGAEWARVRAANGLDGWVPARYLAAER